MERHRTKSKPRLAESPHVLSIEGEPYRLRSTAIMEGSTIKNKVISKSVSVPVKFVEKSYSSERGGRLLHLEVYSLPKGRQEMEHVDTLQVLFRKDTRQGSISSLKEVSRIPYDFPSYRPWKSASVTALSVQQALRWAFNRKGVTADKITFYYPSNEFNAKNDRTLLDWGATVSTSGLIVETLNGAVLEREKGMHFATFTPVSIEERKFSRGGSVLGEELGNLRRVKE